MNITAVAVTATILCIASPASAQSLTGTWKGDVASAELPTKPDVFMVKDGVFTCSTCIPAVKVAADGQFHRLGGHPYWDEIKVSVVSPTSVRYDYRLKGKDTSTSTDTVSADGETLTSRSHSTAASNAAGKAIDGGSTQKRVAPRPAGAHATSGSWRTTKVEQPSTDAPLTIVLEDSGKALTLRSGIGEHFTATYGGPAVMVVGDQGHTMAAVRRIDALTVEETDTRDGKPVITYRYALQPDGRTIRMTVTDLRKGQVTKVNLIRQ
jgi:hypothetical protein